MTNRTALVALYLAAFNANGKVQRNANKLAWMDATRRMGGEVAHFSQQLAGYQQDAKKANDAFAAACIGMEASEICAIITEAHGLKGVAA